MQDSTHSILHSAKRFFTGTAFSRLSGLIRDIAMAFAFGTQDTVAAFLVAFRFSHLLRRLLGEGALQTAFIPQFETLKKESPLRAAYFFRNIYAGLTFLLAGIVLISMIALGMCLQWADLSPGNQTILRLTLLLTPGLFFICLFGLNASLLQCEKNYFTPSFAPVAFNLIWTIGVFCTWHFPIGTAMNVLSLFVILACACQWLMTLPKTLRILNAYGLNNLWKNTSPFSQDVMRMAKPLLLGIIGVAASQINNALDSVFARYADGEGPAFLWYAIRMQQLPLALFGIALSGALLPPLARALKNNELSNYKYFLQFALQRGTTLMIPLTCGIFVLGSASVSFIYGRGDFNAASVLGTTYCLWGYGIGLIPMTLILILAPAFYAQDDYRTPAKGSLYAMLLNTGLNGWFVMGLGWGATSVAIATSIAAWYNCGMLFFALKKKNGPFISGSFWTNVKKVGLASIVASCAVMLTALYWPEYEHTFTMKASYFIGLTFVFFSSLWAAARFLKANDLLHLLKSEPTPLPH